MPVKSVFREKVTKPGEPEVVGVEFPDMGLSRAFFDPDNRVLNVSTYPGNTSREKIDYLEG